MIDHKFDKLSSPMTLEQIQKTDFDIASISSLSDYARRNNSLMVLSGGYATEALCGGKITRPHGDIDLHMSLENEKATFQVFDEVKGIVKQESTKWAIRKQTDKKIEFIEDDENKPFFDKRRIELTIHREKEKPLFTKSVLINSKGKREEVLVVNISELLASKMHKIYSLRDGVDVSKERHTDDRDVYDLRRLLNSPSFNEMGVLQALSERYVDKAEGVGVDMVAKEEFEYVSKLYG